MGRTKNEEARKKYHTEKPNARFPESEGYTFVPRYQNLTKSQARGLEQAVIASNGGKEMLENKINGLNPFDQSEKANGYRRAAVEFLYNRGENEILNLLGW